MTVTDTLPAPATDPHEIEPFVPPSLDPRWAALAAPFPPEDIERKPQPVQKNDQDKYQCRAGTRGSADGYFCGGFHARSLHIVYVGHAGITKRLNDVLGPDGWAWEYAHRQVDKDVLLAALQSGDREMLRMVLDAAPPLYQSGGLWIRLTILGHTKPGFGDASGKNPSDPMAVKEIIGDAIRNGAMRFGVGLYLWSKSDAAKAMQQASGIELTGPVVEDDEPQPRPQRQQGRQQGQQSNRADGQTAAQRAIAQRRQADAARGGQQAQRPPRPRDDGEALAAVDAIVAASEADTLRAAWRTANAWAGKQDTDVRHCLDAEAVRILAIPAGPVTYGQLVVLAQKHLEREGMSIKDHIAADSYDVDPATGGPATS
jgi:hypothetical protein